MYQVKINSQLSNTPSQNTTILYFPCTIHSPSLGRMMKTQRGSQGIILWLRMNSCHHFLTRNRPPKQWNCLSIISCSPQHVSQWKMGPISQFLMNLLQTHIYKQSFKTPMYQHKINERQVEQIKKSLHVYTFVCVLE